MLRYRPFPLHTVLGLQCIIFKRLHLPRLHQPTNTPLHTRFQHLGHNLYVLMNFVLLKSRPFRISHAQRFHYPQKYVLERHRNPCSFYMTLGQFRPVPCISRCRPGCFLLKRPRPSTQKKPVTVEPHSMHQCTYQFIWQPLHLQHPSGPPHDHV